MARAIQSWIGNRPNEEIMPDPLAYFLTWTTYGTWLPGDERGWVLRGHGFQLPDPVLAALCESVLVEPVLYLDPEQRDLVEKTIAEHCKKRNWELHAVNARTTHVHSVITANYPRKKMRSELKSWCTRRLNELNEQRGARQRQNWWTEKGSVRYIGDEESLEAVIHYVLFGQ